MDSGADMIKINVIAVGKVKESYFRDAIAEYSKRLNKFCQINLIEVREENLSNEQKSLKEEAKNIIPKLKGKSVALAIEGRQIDSVELSKMINSAISQGEELTFVIGSSCGLDDSVKQAVNDKISFSKMTFPHTLARVILFEQIYRAFTILSGNTYHK